MKYLIVSFFLGLSFITQAQNLALNMYADTLHRPFIYGVASGDPTSNSVQLWTYAGDSLVGQSVTWQIATDAQFANIVANGSVTVQSTNAYCIKPVAEGLQPFTKYFYRFITPNNRSSVIGQTRTAPASPTQPAKFGIASCSSVYSGYFNGYRHMANDPDMNAIIHLGDYIYDFVDQDEQIRIPTPFPTSPNNLEEWRDRHKYYLLDPDLRLARQMHPWIQTWDNHDFENNGPVGTQAFFEFTAVTQPIQTDSTRIYRKVSYGLVDIFLIDLMRYRNNDEISPGNNSSLGLTQFGWLTQGLATSTAKWKIVASPKMVTPWSIAGLELILGTNSPVLFTSSWDGFPAERLKLLQYLDSANVNNVIFISGDSHFSQSADLPLDPNGADYNSETGEGSVAVEYLPTSISRGNFDEMGYPANLQDFIIGIINTNNPNHQYTEILQHGYGTLIVAPDSAEAEYVYCPILEITDDTTHAGRLVVEDGNNYWRRGGATNPSNINETSTEKIILYPNPANNVMWVQLPKATKYNTIEVYDNVGKKISSQKITSNIERLETALLNQGMYVISLTSQQQAPTFIRFLKE